MKLPNFFYHDQFTALREKMGADYIDISLTLDWKYANSESERAIFARNQEIVIDDFSKVKTNKDGTFTYNNKKIFSYISEGGTENHKFHIVECATLKGFKRNNSYGKKYTVSYKVDGIFRVKNKNSGRIEEVALKVCENCLKHYNYKNYNEVSDYEKYDIREHFNIEEFFNLCQGNNEDLINGKLRSKVKTKHNINNDSLTTIQNKNVVEQQSLETKKIQELPENLSLEEKKIYLFLQENDKQHFDILAKQLDLTPATVNVAIFNLLMEDLIEKLPGDYYLLK